MKTAHGTPILFTQGDSPAALERLELLGGEDTIYNEAWLQRLIHDCPACLPVDEIEPGFDRLVAVCQELPTKHGPIDNLLMTPQGDLVLVEAKLWRNPEARRRVVAQALDYASCLFEMEYSEFEASVLRGRFPEGKVPARLYDLFAELDTLDERDFIDAVSANLRRGRALILVVGDGIRAEVVRLSSLLQSHAGARFTFALVELALFRMPKGQGTMIFPRTLACTQMIERGVIQIEDKRVVVVSPSIPTVAGKAPRSAAKSISAEQFYEDMEAIDPKLPERLQTFVARLEQLGVYPEFQRTLNLKWDPPEGRAFNLGYIKRSGALWTEASTWYNRQALGQQYNEALAAALDLQINKQNKNGWHVVTKAGSPPRIDQLAAKFDAWYQTIEQFLVVLRKHYEEQASGV